MGSWFAGVPTTMAKQLIQHAEVEQAPNSVFASTLSVWES